VNAVSESSQAKWLEALFNQYYDLLYDVGVHLCKGQPALLDGLYDALQEVFIALWRKRNKLVDHPNIGGWLVVALRFELQARMKKEGRRTKAASYSLDDPDSAPPLADPTPSIADNLLYKEKIEALKALLGIENTRLFLDYTLGGQSAKQVAVQYGLTESGVWMRISRIKKKIYEHPEMFTLFLWILLGSRV